MKRLVSMTNAGKNTSAHFYRHNSKIEKSGTRESNSPKKHERYAQGSRV